MAECQQPNHLEKSLKTDYASFSVFDAHPEILLAGFFAGIPFAILMCLKFMLVLIASIKVIMVGLPPEA
ncbi:conserved hypothetical protein [delta proteobacterium NaphS2]|nr:conserved hypothetical protein [delta proteobacterium NaphS2]